MKRALMAALVAAGIVTGLTCSEILWRSAVCRGAIGRWSGRGQLLAIARGTAIYESDVAGRDADAVREAIAATNLHAVDRTETVENSALASAEGLLHAQFGDERTLTRSLKESGLSEKRFRQLVVDHLRGVGWLERQVNSASLPTDEICRSYAHQHPGEFVQPQRFRVSHIFLAAHSGTPPEEMEAKRKLIGALAKSLAQGADFVQLAMQASEDESSKARGGDLSFLCAARTPPEFFAEVARMAPGQTSSPFRSHLGFHIAKVTDMRPSRAMIFDEVKHEIAINLENRSRSIALAGLVAHLNTAEFSRIPR